MTTQNALNTQLVFPAGSTAISQLLYTSAANVVSGLATGNNGIVLTSNSGVPSVATTFGQGLAVASSQLSVGGANNIPFNTGKGIQDNNGNSQLLFTVTASAVNYWSMANAATGISPALMATGSDTNVNGTISTKGTGALNIYSNSNANVMASFIAAASSVNYLGFKPSATGVAVSIIAVGSDTNVPFQIAGQGNSGAQVQGTTAGGNAPAGYVGEFISSVIAYASAVSISSATAKNLTSISLTAGDWDVYGNVNFFGAAVTLQDALCWVSTTSATLPDGSLYNGYTTSTSQMSGFGGNTPYVRISISSTTTVYISGYIILAASTCTMCGGIYARRVR